MINESLNKWRGLISEELHVSNQEKLSWMSEYAQIHSVYEGLQTPGQTASGVGGIYSTPLNTYGMGNPMAPQQGTTTGFPGTGATDGMGYGNTGADFHNPNYQVGSGDVPMSTLAVALEIAAMTVGFEIVPTIPATSPWVMLSYFDTPYLGGKMGRANETSMDGKGPENENKPIYIKFNIDAAVTYGASYTEFAKGLYIAVESADGIVYGTVIGRSRIDNSLIIKVDGTAAAGAITLSTTKPNNIVSSSTVSIANVFSTAITKIDTAADDNTAYTAAANVTVGGSVVCRPDLVSNAADHVQGFANFFNGSTDPMTRAQNETGVGNVMGARIFTKWYQMGAYEVEGSVTRQQLQDMPLMGIDVIGSLLEGMQNEISQHWNYEILERVFRLGVTNHETQYKYQGVDLNLFLGDAANTSKQLNTFPGYDKYIDILGNQPATRAIPNAIQNTSAENVHTHQRRVMSRLLAASNLIANTSRRGRANWAVMNTQMVSALQDAASFVIAPMTNTLTQGGQESLYFAGSVCGLNIYVDPYMLWNDGRICVGRKGKVDNNKVTEPGVVFQPYILCDTVQIVAEGTMAPKLLCNSRAAVVDCGFHPEQNYLTFMVASANDAYLI